MRTGFKFAWLYICLLIVFASSSQLCSGMAGSEGGNYDPANTFAREKLREDFSVIRASLEEGHGALYRYSTKAEMDGVFDAAYKKIDRDMTEREFLRILLPVVGAVNCGHTSVRRSQFYTWMAGMPVTFPMGVRFLKQKPYLVRNYSENADIALGGELVSINGMPMEQIVSDLLPALSSDARIETSKRLILSSSVRFSQLFNIFYGITKSYEVAYRHPDTGAITTAVVKAKKQADVLETFQRRYPELAKTFPLISFWEKGGIPVLTIRTFGSGALGRGGFDYPKFLRETFQKLVDSKAPSLIIDLRENGGGEMTPSVKYSLPILWIRITNTIPLSKLKRTLLIFSNIQACRKVSGLFQKTGSGRTLGDGTIPWGIPTWASRNPSRRSIRAGFLF